MVAKSALQYFSALAHESKNEPPFIHLILYRTPCSPCPYSVQAKLSYMGSHQQQQSRRARAGSRELLRYMHHHPAPLPPPPYAREYVFGQEHDTSPPLLSGERSQRRWKHLRLGRSRNA